MKKLQVQREREFCPHHILLDIAYYALEDAKEKRGSRFYFQLTAITFSALALEALANSFGNRLFEEWSDFETASPVAKVRMVSKQLGIEHDFKKEPWSTVKWLVKVRNRVVHAKPEFVKVDSAMTQEEYEKIRTKFPESKLEKDITLSNARRSVKAVEDIFDEWCKHLSGEELGGLASDGWYGTTSPIIEESSS